MRSIQKLLGLSEAAPTGAKDTETVRQIAAELDRLPRDEARYIASFAYVMARVAHADLEVSEAETREMERLVGGMADLGEVQTGLVVQIAKHQAVNLGGTENYLVTRQFRELSTHPQRIGLLRCLFAVAAADDTVTHDEEQQISQIGVELGLTSPEVASVRSSYRDKLATLKLSD
jgi:uncharacterized tellurite resistance protein B-like protein